jgi:hypothetical protein
MAALPLLQPLAISDHQIVNDRGADHLLITSALFAALSLNPSSPGLVPHLCSLTCHSLLQFDDAGYLEFLLSRRRPASSDLAPFLSQMYWLDGHDRNLDPEVNARIRELRVQREVICEFGPVEE